MSIRDMVDKVLTSLPTRGGWIEIQLPAVTLCRVASPSPHGEGGLKFGVNELIPSNVMSLPTRGGWIEMRREGMYPCSVFVPPHTGRVD